MVVSHVGTTTRTVDSSAAESGILMPTGAAAVDLAILTVAQERTGACAVPAGWTVLRAEDGSTQMADLVAWRRLRRSDLGTTTPLSWASARRFAASVSVYRGCTDPAFTAGAYAVLGSSTTAVACPAVTPAAAGSMLVAHVGANLYDAAYAYTAVGSPSAGWTERADVISTSNTAANGMTYVADQLLTGGAGASQPGMTMTASTPHYFAMPSTTVLAPGGPTGDAGDDQTVEPGSTVTLTGAGTGTWSQTGGTPVTLIGSGLTRTYTAPVATGGDVDTFAFGGTSCTVTVLPATDFILIGGTWLPGVMQLIT